MANEHHDVLEAAAEIGRAKVAMREAHVLIETARLPGVGTDIRGDAMRSIRGSMAYLDVLTAQVYAAASHQERGNVIEMEALEAPASTEEFDRAYLGEA